MNASATSLEESFARLESELLPKLSAKIGSYVDAAIEVHRESATKPLNRFKAEYCIHARNFARCGLSLADYCRSRCIDEGLSIDPASEELLNEMDRAEDAQKPAHPLVMDPKSNAEQWRELTAGRTDPTPDWYSVQHSLEGAVGTPL